MRARIAIFVAIACFYGPLVGQGMEIVLSHEGIEVSYVEPSQNYDESPLVDLAHTTIYCEIHESHRTSIVQVFPVLASSVIGGQPMSFLIPKPTCVTNKATLVIWLTATDQTGNESVKSPEVIIRKNMCQKKSARIRR